MNARQIVLAMSLTTTLVTFLVLALLKPSGTSEIRGLITFMIFSGLLGFSVFGVMGGKSAQTTSSLLGSLGVSSGTMMIAITISFFAVAAYFAENSTMSLVLDAVAILVVVFSIGLGHITASHIAQVESETNFISSHTLWRNELAKMKLATTNSEIRMRLEKLAEKSQYLARDLSKEGLPINQEIDSALENLSIANSSSEWGKAFVTCETIERLFSEREMHLLNQRANNRGS